MRHISKLPPTPVILWMELGGKPKWLPLNFGYHDVRHTAPVTFYVRVWAGESCGEGLSGQFSLLSEEIDQERSSTTWPDDEMGS